MGKTSIVHRLIIAAIIFAGFVVLYYVSRVIFCDYPACMDEYNYLYQAKIFASGHMYVHADSKLKDLFETWTVFTNGKLFSEFPPGFSAILSLGVKLGLPGIINPLLSAGTLLLIYFIGAELSGSLFSLLALFLIITNGYFLGFR